MSNIPFYTNSEASNVHRYELDSGIYFEKHGIEIYQNQGLVVEFEPNRMDFYVVAINRNGNANKDIGLLSYQIIPKTIHFLAPGVLHNLSDLSEDIDGFYICFKKEFYLKYFADQKWLDTLDFYRFDGRPLFQLDEETFDEVEKSFIAIASEQKKSSMDSYEFIWTHLHNIHLLSKRFSNSNVVTPPNKNQTTNHILLVERFKKMVDKHFKETRNVSFYAQQLFITPQYLSEIIKENTGASPIYWINKRTFLEANYLLRYTNLSIKEIAVSLHFSSSAYFTKFYKKFSKGVTPSEFLINLKN